jgi:sulfonate transport system permease protein
MTLTDPAKVHNHETAEATADAAPLLVRLPTGGRATSPRGRRRLPRGLARLAGIVLFFAVWEFAALVGLLKPQDLAAPSVIFTTGFDMLRSGALESAIWVSLQRVVWGLVIGVPVGAALAIVAGLTRAGENLIDGNVQMLRFVPVIGLESLFILWLGVGETAKVALIVLGVVFPVYINVFTAIRSLDPGLLELAHVVGLGRWGRIRRIVLPGVLPAFFMGLRIAVAVAWLILVFVEQINASNGLGYLIIQAQTFFESGVIVVALVTYALLGLVSEGLVRLAERKVLRWQPGR